MSLSSAVSSRIPRAHAPRRNGYIVAGTVLSQIGDALYSITENDFVGLVMLQAGGCANPMQARLLYRELMTEAGLPPLIGDAK